MSKLYKENGLLSEHGLNVTSQVKMAIYKLLNQNDEIKQLSEGELRTLGGSLQKIVGDLIAERIQFTNQVAKKFAEMNDKQFYGYLEEKYGDDWMLVSLSKEEFDRLPRLSHDEIQAALQEGLKAREEAIKATPSVNINPGLRFK
jgi:hypothetical protein